MKFLVRSASETVSDNWVVLIPRDPYAVLERERLEQALKRLRELAPEANEVEFTTSDEPEFFDCGTNFKRIVCPSCGQDVPVSWWHDQMELDFNGTGFRLNQYRAPCCQSTHTLNDLRYDWPQGFARCSLQLMNPNIGKLADEPRLEVESILGVPMRVIYQHL